MNCLNVSENFVYDSVTNHIDMFAGSNINKVNKTNNCLNETKKDNPVITITGTSTSNSITVKSSVKYADSGILKYEYSKDGGKTYETSNSDTYVFKNLDTNKTYEVKTRVTTKNGGVGDSNTLYITTKNLSAPTFDEKGDTVKTVTITYPSGCGSTFKCSYVKDGVTKEVTSDTVNVKFTDSGVITATVSDGKNSETSSYNLKIGRVITYDYKTNGGDSVIFE